MTHILIILWPDSETKSCWCEDADQIIIEGKEHEKDNEDQSDLLGYLHFFDTDGFPQNCFQAQKKKMAPIEDGNRKEVDDTQVNAEDGHEEDKTQQSPSGLLSSQLGDHDGSTDCLCRNYSFDQFHDGHHCEFDSEPGLGKSFADCLKGADPLDDDFFTWGNADNKRLSLFPEDIFLCGRFWGDLDVKDLTLPFYLEKKFLSFAIADDFGEILPFRYGFSIDGQDKIPLF